MKNLKDLIELISGGMVIYEGNLEDIFGGENLLTKEEEIEESVDSENFVETLITDFLEELKMDTIKERSVLFNIIKDSIVKEVDESISILKETGYDVSEDLYEEIYMNLDLELIPLVDMVMNNEISSQDYDVYKNEIVMNLMDKVGPNKEETDLKSMIRNLLSDDFIDTKKLASITVTCSTCTTLELLDINSKLIIGLGFIKDDIINEIRKSKNLDLLITLEDVIENINFLAENRITDNDISVEAEEIYNATEIDRFIHDRMKNLDEPKYSSGLIYEFLEYMNMIKSNLI